MLGHSSDATDRVAADALSEVLQDLRLTGASYCRAELTAPWGLEIGPEEGAIFHFVAKGGCWLKTASHEPVRLETGDVVLLPHGTGHLLVDELNSPARRLREVHRERIGDAAYRLRAGGAGTRALLVCSGVGFEEPSAHPLVELMPHVLHVRGGGGQERSLRPLLEAMASELADQRIGAATVMTRLADIIITRLVRAWAESQPVQTTGWLAAIRDPQIGRALGAFHRRPSEAWSVESLAAIAGLSRSIFSERFSAVLGVPPARYVARWRMHLAGRLLTAERLTISEVASRLGYESEASFSRAFRRFMGDSPSAFRQRRPSAPNMVSADRGVRSRFSNPPDFRKIEI